MKTISFAAGLMKNNYVKFAVEIEESHEWIMRHTFLSNEELEKVIVVSGKLYSKLYVNKKRYFTVEQFV